MLRSGKTGPHGMDELERDVIGALEREWNSLASRLNAPLRQWSEREPALAAFPTAPHLLRSLRRLRGDHDAENAILAALLRQARVDARAGRVVLQAILPGLKMRAGRLLFEAAERDEIWSLLLANVWQQIRRYPLEQRPRRIAANLLQEAFGATLRELDEARRAQRQLPPEPLADTPGEASGDDVEVVLARAARAGVISYPEARLILETRIYGNAVAALASAQDMPYMTLYMRRHRAERRLRVFLGDRPVKNDPERRPLFSARAVGDGLAGSTGGAAVTDPEQRR